MIWRHRDTVMIFGPAPQEVLWTHSSYWCTQMDRLTEIKLSSQAIGGKLG